MFLPVEVTIMIMSMHANSMLISIQSHISKLNGPNGTYKHVILPEFQFYCDRQKNTKPLQRQWSNAENPLAGDVHNQGHVFRQKPLEIRQSFVLHIAAVIFRESKFVV